MWISLKVPALNTRWRAIYGARLSEDIKIEYPCNTKCYIMSQVLTSEGHMRNPREEEMGEG